ncbi:Microtubule-actin cross-linking factor 1, partial [Camelus dromedarius]
IRDSCIGNKIIQDQIKINLFYSHAQVRKHINDLYEDLRDGHNLISLLEVLSGIKLEPAGLKTLRLVSMPSWRHTNSEEQEEEDDDDVPHTQNPAVPCVAAGEPAEKLQHYFSICSLARCVLTGILAPREKGRMRFHRLQNVQIALDFLKQRQVKLVNIRNDDITDGNPKLTLGLIWTIILHF